MAERVSPPLPLPPRPPHSSSTSDLPNPPSLSLHDPGSSQSAPVFQSGTYVVLVPKDQIYRVPPPENARYVQEHQNPQQKKQRSYCPCRRWCCSCCFVIVLILAIVIGVSIALSIGLGTWKKPEFQVQHFAVKNSAVAKSRHDYELKLMVRNPNKKSEIGYKNGGIASLFYKDLKLGEAKFPVFDQENGNSTEIEIIIKGFNVSLPEKKSHVSFTLALNLPTKFKTTINLLISCNFEVDTLAKGTRVINQKCVTN